MLSKFTKTYGPYSHAANELIRAKDTAKTNAPINEQAGNKAQADLENHSIKSFDAALSQLRSKPMKMGFKRTQK